MAFNRQSIEFDANALSEIFANWKGLFSEPFGKCWEVYQTFGVSYLAVLNAVNKI